MLHESVPKKSLAISGVARSLRAGGRLGLSDVTIEPGVLPEELAGHIGNVLCLTDALTVDGYASLMNDGGFDLVEALDVSDEITKILDGIQARFGFLMAVQGFLGGGDLLGQAPRLIRRVRNWWMEANWATGYSWTKAGMSLCPA